MKKELKIYLASPRGFCAGVKRAIEIVEKAINKYGAPVYVRHEIVHNKQVVDELREKGAIFVDELSEVKDNSRPVIFSAHGVPKSVPDEAKLKKLSYVDATCPLVSKVHKEVIRFAQTGKDIIMIGHKNHPEVEGTLGRFPENSRGNMYLVENLSQAEKIEVNQPENLCLVTQTTLSVSDTEEIVFKLKERFPLILEPKSEDICYATQNRQDAVKQLALESDLIIVVGSENSSNSNRLKELAENCGVQSFLMDDPEKISSLDLDKINVMGITAGASAPEELVQQMVHKCNSLGYKVNEEISGLKEDVYFKLPVELR